MKYFMGILLVVMFALISCNDKLLFCDKDYLKPPKNITTKLSKSQKNALSDLTSILNGYNGQSLILENNKMYSNVTYELFFDIGKDFKNLYLVQTRYKSKSEDGSLELFSNRTKDEFLNRQQIIEIPVNQLNGERVSKYIGNLIDGHYVNININSQFNDAPFREKTIQYKNGKPIKTEYCENIDNFSISLHNERQGQELYSYLINFINVFNE